MKKKKLYDVEQNVLILGLIVSLRKRCQAERWPDPPVLNGFRSFRVEMHEASRVDPRKRYSHLNCGEYE